MVFQRAPSIPLVVSFCLVLAGCGTTGQLDKTTRAAAPQPPATEGPAPIHGFSSKDRLLQIAKDEWIFFGQQKVVFSKAEESIPRVGIWEDEDEEHSERINLYWQATGEPSLSGRDCDQAWSAAFIVWLMRTVGVPETLFPSTISHRVYLSKFLTEAPDTVFLPHTISEYQPKPGDLICAIRENSVSDETKGLSTPEDLKKAKLHCDIVMETDGRTLQAIGGNVRNSVSRSFLTLSPQGHLQPTPRRPWFLIIENRLN